MDWHKMTTLNEMIEVIRAENPQGLRVGDDDSGYTDLTAKEYEEQIAEWAANRLAKETRIAEAEAAKVAVEAKLSTLGLSVEDLKALGL
jgi:hypothetical protein